MRHSRAHGWRRLRDSRSLGISREEEGRQRPGGAEGTREEGWGKGTGIGDREGTAPVDKIQIKEIY